MPHGQGSELAALYALGAPIEREDTAEGVVIRAHLPEAEARRFAASARTAAEWSCRSRSCTPTRACRPRAHEHDAGLDLRSVEACEIAPGDRALVPVGLAVEIPAGHAGLVIPRSGLAARHGITILNAPGLVDAGYRGELRWRCSTPIATSRSRSRRATGSRSS